MDKGLYYIVSQDGSITLFFGTQVIHTWTEAQVNTELGFVINRNSTR